MIRNSLRAAATAAVALAAVATITPTATAANGTIDPGEIVFYRGTTTTTLGAWTDMWASHKNFDGVTFKYGSSTYGKNELINDRSGAAYNFQNAKSAIVYSDKNYVGYADWVPTNTMKNFHSYVANENSSMQWY